MIYKHDKCFNRENKIFWHILIYAYSVICDFQRKKISNEHSVKLSTFKSSKRARYWLRRLFLRWFARWILYVQRYYLFREISCRFVDTERVHVRLAATTAVILNAVFNRPRYRWPASLGAFCGTRRPDIAEAANLPILPRWFHKVWYKLRVKKTHNIAYLKLYLI